MGCCGHIWLVKSYEIIWNHVNLHFRSFVIQLHADPLTARKPGRLLQQNILQGTSFPQTGARDITWPTQRWYLRVVVDSCWHGLWKPYTVFWKWIFFLWIFTIQFVLFVDGGSEVLNFWTMEFWGTPCSNIPIYFLQKQSQHPLNPSRID